jgi:ankyrin repeat protein
LKIPDNLPKASLQPAAALRKSATQKYPFLEYAVHNVLYHADIAESGSISQAGFLDDFPLPRWVKLDNLFEKHEVRRHTKSVSFLYMLAELNMANLIRVLGSVSRCMDLEAERYGCPLFAAAATSSDKALEVCLETIEVRQADSSAVEAVIEPQSQHKSTQRAARRDFVYSRSKDFLLSAAELGHDRVLAILIRSGRFGIDSKDSRDRTVLWWVSRNDCEMSARLLLAADSALVNSKDKDDKTTLFIAAEQGNQAVMEVLLEMNGDVDAQSGRHGNALYVASARGHKEIATLLLDKGADANAQGGQYGNALQAASWNGHKEIATVLLDKGADVNAQGGADGNALYAASARDNKEMATLLLDKGADVNAQGGAYGNALQAASAGGHKEMATLLLDKGADVNAQGGGYGNALQAALEGGHKEIATLLRRKIASGTS